MIFSVNGREGYDDFEDSPPFGAIPQWGREWNHGFHGMARISAIL